MNVLRDKLPLAAAGLLLLFLSACATSDPRTHRAGISNNTRHTPTDPARPTRNPSQPPLVGASAWRSEAAKWIGVPYRLGGNTRAGLDCSGLIANMVRNVARLELPRTAYEQSRAGVAIPQRDLRPGDLLFFQTGKENRINHAGIYLGQNQFIHASTSQGVIYSNLDETYYAEAYRGARRVTR